MYTEHTELLKNFLLLALIGFTAYKMYLYINSIMPSASGKNYVVNRINDMILCSTGKRKQLKGPRAKLTWR